MPSIIDLILNTVFLFWKLLITWTTGAHGHVPISGLNSMFVSSAKDLPLRMQSTNFQELPIVHPTRSPKTKDVFMARNLSLMAAQSAKGLPDMAMTRRTMCLDRGITANRPAEAAPAPGPNLKVERNFAIATFRSTLEDGSLHDLVSW